MRIALIAHDKKKKDIVAFVRGISRICGSMRSSPQAQLGA